MTLKVGQMIRIRPGIGTLASDDHMTTENGGKIFINRQMKELGGHIGKIIDISESHGCYVVETEGSSKHWLWPLSALTYTSNYVEPLI